MRLKPIAIYILITYQHRDLLYINPKFLNIGDGLSGEAVQRNPLGTNSWQRFQNVIRIHVHKLENSVSSSSMMQSLCQLVGLKYFKEWKIVRIGGLASANLGFAMKYAKVAPSVESCRLYRSLIWLNMGSLRDLPRE
jgi:hypothetical protein